eukprot:gene8690-637_t
MKKIFTQQINKKLFKRNFFNFFNKNKPEEKKPQVQKKNQEPKSTPPQQPKFHKKQVHTFDLPNIKHIIAVASGKGGVGKSTVSTNLAVALSSGFNKRVGLVDADIYGPSIHKMMNLSGKPKVTEDKKLIPKSNYGIETMSMGYIVQEDAPTIWRGPMVMGAVEQLLKDVKWSELDILVIDLPPGTGDAQLTISQRVALTGAVIVSTPQDISLIDARRGVNMFKQVNVPILGLVENMSFFKCQNCGHVEHIFSHGGAKNASEELNTPFLGEIPINIDIRTNSDAGTPVALTRTVISEPYYKIAEKVIQSLEESKKNVDEATPKIIIE